MPSKDAAWRVTSDTRSRVGAGRYALNNLQHTDPGARATLLGVVDAGVRGRPFARDGAGICGCDPFSVSGGQMTVVPPSVVNSSPLT
jgi:hypothetical protein